MAIEIILPGKNYKSRKIDFFKLHTLKLNYKTFALNMSQFEFWPTFESENGGLYKSCE